MRKYLSVVETAKLVRLALKESFPKTKFSVRSESYSGGASINVNWTDGPNKLQVKGVIDRFSGATFNSMEDIKEYKNSFLDGESVSFGADFIFENRDFSRETLDKVLERVKRKYGLNENITVENYKSGSLYHINESYSSESIQSLINRELSKWTDVPKANESKTAKRVG